MLRDPSEEPWEVRAWYNGGVLTGWRVMRGAGWNAEIAEGFVYNMYVKGDYDRAWTDANELCSKLNKDLKK